MTRAIQPRNARRGNRPARRVDVTGMRPLLALLAAVLCACGGGRDELFERNRDLCRDVAIGMTVRQVADRFGFSPSRAECLNNWKPLPQDQCPREPQRVCALAFVSSTADDRACRDDLGSGICAYWCEVRIAGDPAEDLSNPICAREFIDAQ
jgi:hypothetical protein